LPLDIPESGRYIPDLMSWHRKSHWQILVALLLAVGTGLLLKSLPPDSGFAEGLLSICRVLGELFMRALRMIIVPIVLVSIICGIGGMGATKGFGRMGAKTMGFYAITTLAAAALGLVLVNLIQPGLSDGQPNPVVKQAIEAEAGKLAGNEKATAIAAKVGEQQEGVGATLRDLLLRMVPNNIIESAAATDLLGLIFFALLFGIAMATLEGPHIEATRSVFQGLNGIILKITGWIMACAPLGVFALVVPVVAATGGGIFKALAWYFVTVASGLLLHLFVIMPLFLLAGRVNPRRHFSAMRDCVLTAFSTASSNATLPVTMRCVTEEAGVSPRVAGFTLPVGATVNMNGTALYECVAVIFVAQVLGVDLSIGTQITVVLLALLTSVGVAGVPSASLVAIVLILQTVKIEGAGAAIAVLFSVDRLLDMGRTAVNVFGDTCGAVVVARSEGEDLFPERDS
jgi:Na+/H+-dicarboxylate symporter